MLIVRPVVTPYDLEFVRNTRNECRMFMTGFTGFISVEDQLKWWLKRDEDTLKLYVYNDLVNDVGYGMLSYKDDRWFLSLGLQKADRGHGYGTDIYKHLVSVCPGDVWIDVRADNEPSFRAALKAGFELVGAKWAPIYGDKVNVLVKRKS